MSHPPARRVRGSSQPIVRAVRAGRSWRRRGRDLDGSELVSYRVATQPAGFRRGVVLSGRFVTSAAVAIAAGAAILAFGFHPVAPAKAAPGPTPTPITYQPIAPAVYASPNVVATWAATRNEAATYLHAARLWSGLTAYTSQSIAGVPLAVFETWYTPCDVYPIDRASVAECGPAAASTPLAARVRRAITVHKFEVPLQF